MAITKKPLPYEERITQKYAFIVAYGDVSDNAATNLMALPAGTVVKSVSVTVTTNWNSGTSAAASVGTTASGAAYISGVNLLAAGSEYYAWTTGAIITAASQYLTVTVDVDGTAATAGQMTIIVEVEDRTATGVPTS